MLHQNSIAEVPDESSSMAIGFKKVRAKNASGEQLEKKPVSRGRRRKRVQNDELGVNK